MGIFDVFSNSKATSTQNDDTQSAQTTVQDPAAVPTTQADLSDEFSKFASNYNPKADPLDLTNFDNAVQGTTTTDLPAEPVVQPMMVPEQPQMQPAPQLNETPVLNTPVQDLNQTEPAADPMPVAPTQDFQVNNNSQSNQPTEYQPEKQNTEVSPSYSTIETNTSPLNDAIESLPSFDNPTTSSEPAQTAQEVQQIENNPVQAKEFESPDIESENLPATEIDNTPAKEFESPDMEDDTTNKQEDVQPTVEFGVSPSAPTADLKPQGETPLTPEFNAEADTAPAAPEVSSIVPQNSSEQVSSSEDSSIPAETPKVEEETSQVPEPQVQMLQTGISDKSSEPVKSEDSATPEESNDTNKQSETAPLITNNYEKEDTSMIGKINLVNIKKLGFLGLNAPELNEGLKMDLSELSEAVGGMLEEYILDSSMGYAPELLRGLSNKDIVIKSYILKSAYSLFTQEPFNLNEYSNFTSYIFSDALERLKNIIGSSDALVLVYSPGMNNLMSFFSAMGLSMFYKEIGKPIVLHGNEWETVINSLVANKLLDQSVTSSILIASDSNELLSHLQTLDNNFKKLSLDDSKSKIVDLRKEDDELIYIK